MCVCYITRMVECNMCFNLVHKEMLALSPMFTLGMGTSTCRIMVKVTNLFGWNSLPC